MARKRLSLRRPDTCAVCGRTLSIGDPAEWDSVARSVTGAPCADARTDPPPPAEAPPPPAIDPGRPGASARAEYARRHEKREQQIEAKWGTGRIGRLAKALSDDPQSTEAWAKGAAGEERVAEVLRARLGLSALLLHDRRVPRTRGNIDHLVIASSGVWVIAAKRHSGKVERRDVGGLLRSDMRLFVGGRDRSKLVDGLGWQIDAVRNALGEGSSVPVHACLSFVGAEWPVFFAKPFQLAGVWVSWPSKLAELAGGSGPLGEEDIERVARVLAERLPSR